MKLTKDILEKLIGETLTDSNPFGTPDMEPGTREKQLIEIFDVLVADIAEKTTVDNLYPVDGDLLYQADELLRQYHKDLKR